MIHKAGQPSLIIAIITRCRHCLMALLSQTSSLQKSPLSSSILKTGSAGHSGGFLGSPFLGLSSVLLVRPGEKSKDRTGFGN